jgi:phosphonate transport system permease protein
VVLVWSFRGVGFDAGRLGRGLPHLLDFFGEMTPPDWSISRVVWHASIETLQVTIAGTFLGALGAYPLGLMAASNWTPRWISIPAKTGLAVIRSIPLLILALLFLSVAGLGAFAGMLAIAFHSIGVLGRYVAEEIEAVDPRPLRAIEGTGASGFQVLQHGLVPEVFPQMVAHLAIRFEMNLRESTILGLVGAGGLGTYIILYTKQFQWPRVVPLLGAIMVLVIGGELLTWRIRRHLL